MQRFPVLDGLRATSILLVLSAHMLPLGPKTFHLNDTAGAMGMSLFFSLSGFLIASNLLANQNILFFFIRRLMRILPLAYLYLITIYVLIAPEPSMLLGNFLFVENYIHSYIDSWNGHFWSLCVEIHFYVAIGFTVMLFGSQGLWLVVPACLAITVLRITNGAYVDIRTHLRVDEILAGSCVALFVHKGALKSKIGNACLGMGLGFWFLASSGFSGPIQYLRPYSSAIMLYLVLSLRPSRLVDVLESPFARYLAAISYALYVVHPATVHGWMNEGSVSLRYMVKRPLSIILTFLLAHLSTFYWERHWIRLGKWLTRRRIFRNSRIST